MSKGEGKPLPSVEAAATGRFGPPNPPNFGPTNAPNVALHVNTPSLNINMSNLSALERLAQHSPEIANKVLTVSETSMRIDGKKYAAAAIVSGLIAVTLIICATVVLLQRGFWVGITFFALMVALSAIIGVIYTGRAQDLSWTVKLFTGGFTSPKVKDITPQGDADQPPPSEA